MLTPISSKEISVRDLADSFRHNVLPDVVQAIGLKHNGIDFDDLPDHDILLWSSKAQAELNYAVQYSFEKEKVTCTSTLTASKSWIAFDDEHFKEKGYRLNADPYWISPPPGSIVPLWHRGGAPNYQTKLIIAKHRFDPVKFWKRRIAASTDRAGKDANLTNAETAHVELLSQETSDAITRVHIYYCGVGGTTLKLAEKLRKLVNATMRLHLENLAA
jgi:hypothetical protein